MPICLIPIDGAAPVPLDKAVMLFGRQPDCDIVLTTSRKVSRHHCCVAQINGEFVVRDLGSLNGIRINGALIRKEGRLRIGDELHVGDIGYRLAAIENLPKRKAAAAPQPKPILKTDPKYLSQDIPVAMPEEGNDFSVEQTAPKMKPIRPSPSAPRRPPLEITDDDLIDD